MNGNLGSPCENCKVLKQQLEDDIEIKEKFRDVNRMQMNILKNMEKKRYKIVKGLFYFEIIDTKNNFIVGSQETRSDAERIIKKLEKGKN